LSYTLYGNHADGTYAGIDATNYHLNMPAAFMWVKGMEKAPINIHFNIDDPAFTIATQLKPGKDKYSFSAPDLQYFMDSPTKIGKLHWREWDVTNNGKPLHFRIALEANASEAGVDSLADIVKKITTQASRVFKEYPDYDYGTYTFLASINPYVRGDGMEHRNSTMISLPVNFTTNANALEVFAHEFFHCWNVERIRPKTLEPFNFEKSNMSNELWCAEGFTQYYGDMLMVRAELEKDTAFTGTLSGYINNKANTPGGNMYTPIQASNMAVYVDAGVAIDKTNYPNFFTTYYVYGASVALALDLTLRSQFNSSLDVFMQQMWKQHGKPFIPYTVADMQKALATITNAGFANDFFQKYVYGHEVPDYKSLLQNAGFELQLSSPAKAWMGNVRYTERNGLVLTNSTIRNTPLYDAGVDIDDVITSLDDQPIKGNADMAKVLAAHKPGDKINIVYQHRGEEKSGTITFKENPSFKVATFESLNKTVTPAMLAFRKNWLGTK
jgi:predicted metalloprotease with PDZ domain